MGLISFLWTRENVISSKFKIPFVGKVTENIPNRKLKRNAAAERFKSLSRNQFIRNFIVA
jgi:hypothetical protein